MTDNVLAGRYRLDEQIAIGGMGSVWRAHDQVLRRTVAVKILHDTLAADAAAAERFKREALLAGSVSHPNMANVYDYIEEGGRPGIVMELVEGETLSHLLAREGKLSPERATAIAVGVLDALIAAHEAGIVHRDIKPGNVLLMPNGHVKVADFGIARSLGDSTLTATGTVMGTAHYSAPEQISGSPTTAATDLYSLGVVLYEMLTGARPFGGETPVAIAMARLNETPRSPATLDPSIPRHLNTAVMRALQRDPEDRFPDGEAMRAALLGQPGPAAIDRTQVLPLEHDDETIALTPAAAVKPTWHEDVDEQQQPLKEVVPPAWWGRRVMLVLLPLLLLGLLGAVIGAVTAGPDIVQVPRFTDRSIDEAQRIAERRDLRVEVQEVSSARREGLVLSQDPAQGEQVEAGTTVTLRVSRGNLVNTPNLSGKTKEEAERILEAAGLRLGRTDYTLTGGAAPLTVIDQSPNAGRDVSPGRTVNITIELAPVERKDEGKGKGRGKGGDDD